ncbi:MAG: hypothetical protein AB8C46_12485 [Burkholderiaceae bacterium]
MTSNATDMQIDRSVSNRPAKDAAAVGGWSIVLRWFERYAARRSAQAISRVAVFDSHLGAKIGECADTLNDIGNPAKSKND